MLRYAASNRDALYLPRRAGQEDSGAGGVVGRPKRTDLRRYFVSLLTGPENHGRLLLYRTSGTKRVQTPDVPADEEVQDDPRLSSS